MVLGVDLGPKCPFWTRNGVSGPKIVIFGHKIAKFGVKKGDFGDFWGFWGFLRGIWGGVYVFFGGGLGVDLGPKVPFLGLEMSFLDPK